MTTDRPRQGLHRLAADRRRAGQARRGIIPDAFYPDQAHACIHATHANARIADAAAFIRAEINASESRTCPQLFARVKQLLSNRYPAATPRLTSGANREQA